MQQPGLGLRCLLHHGKCKATLPSCSQRSVHVVLQAHKDAALGLGTEWFAVPWGGQLPAQPLCFEFSGRGGCEALALPAPQHSGGCKSEAIPAPVPSKYPQSWQQQQQDVGIGTKTIWKGFSS